MTASDSRRLWLIFAAALAIRWLYALAIYSSLGADGLQGTDSIGFLQAAEMHAAGIVNGRLTFWDWLIPGTIVMPLFFWSVTICTLLFGSSAALGYVLLQGILDAGTCVLVFRLAGAFNPAYALPAAIAALINPTQIVLSGLVYTDTPFLFFVTLAFIASLRWLRQPDLRTALWLGSALGAAMLTRVMILPAIPVLLVFLIGVVGIQRRLRRGHIAQLAAVAGIVALCIAPVLTRNVVKFGAWSPSSQGGIHLAYWVVPFIKEAYDGTPWTKGNEMMLEKVKQHGLSGNPFEQSRQMEQVAREELAKYGYGVIVKAWLFGAAINLASPAVLLSPPVSNLPRTGFYATEGASSLDKIQLFLFASDNARYAWILLFGILGVAAIRLMQLAGIPAVLRTNPAGALLLSGWCVFVLLASGPIASPKYRLPMESALAVLTAAGFVTLRRFTSRSGK